MLYVMRHGQVETNIHNQINGWNPEELTTIGIEQARGAENKVKALNIEYVLCSPIVRTKQTLNNLNLDEKITVYYDDRLKERNAKSMVYKKVDSVDNNIWYDKTKDIVYEDAEGFKSIIERVKSLLDEIKDKYYGKNILLITHGDICKAIYLYFNQDVQNISEFYQDNCEIVSYEL